MVSLLPRNDFIIGNAPVLSLLELLPKELTWAIIEHAPESVTDLRLASRTLRFRVDDYALQRATIPLVSKILFTGKGAFALRIQINVPICKSRLFKLRLSLRQFPPENMILFVIHSGLKVYNIKSAKNNSLSLVGESIGMTIKKVILSKCDSEELTTVSNILGRMKVDQLNFSTNTLSDESVTHLLETVCAHRVDHLYLQVHSEIHSNPVDVLLKLASHVRTMQIFHYCSESNNDFFGIAQDVWPSVILNMFSKRIDKLYIENFYYKRLLTRNGVDTLTEVACCINETARTIIFAAPETLPTLGKKIWFSASCVFDYIDDLTSYTKNYHSVALSRTFMSVKHASREHEKKLY